MTRALPFRLRHESRSGVWGDQATNIDNRQRESQMTMALAALAPRNRLTRTRRVPAVCSSPRVLLASGRPLGLARDLIRPCLTAIIATCTARKYACARAKSPVLRNSVLCLVWFSVVSPPKSYQGSTQHLHIQLYIYHPPFFLLDNVKEFPPNSRGREDEDDDTAGLLILYQDNKTIHRALGLGGAPVATPAASGEGYVFGKLVAGVPDQLIHCVEDAQRTVSHTTQYFPNIFQRLPSIAFGNLIIRVKQLFSSQGPWVQALP